MAVSDIFCLNNSIAPRLIRILYVVMLVLISIATIAGVVRGIVTIARPGAPRVAIFAARPAAPAPAAVQTQPPAPQAAAPATSAQATPPGPPPAAAQPPAEAATPSAPASGAASLPPAGPRFGRGRGFRGQVMGPGMMVQDFRRGPRMMGARFMGPARGGRNAVMAGTFQIVRALVMGIIAVMVIRILAEMANAVLVTGEKAKA